MVYQSRGSGNFMNFFSRPENYYYYCYYDHNHYRPIGVYREETKAARGENTADHKTDRQMNDEPAEESREYQSLINIINNKQTKFVQVLFAGKCEDRLLARIVVLSTSADPTPTSST